MKINKKKNQKIIIRENGGITLIALILTVIVALILAGITIGAISGDNGLINSTINAKEEAEIANEKEIINIAVIRSISKNRFGNLEEEEFQSELNREVGEDGIVEATDIGNEFEVIFIENNRYYTVDKNGNIGDMQEIIKDLFSNIFLKKI